MDHRVGIAPDGPNIEFMFDWLSSFNTNVVKHDDSFARTTRGKLLGIESAIKDTLQDRTQRVIIVSHFAETFTAIQDMLEKNEIGYDVPTQAMDRAWFDRLVDDECKLQITMAQLLEPLAEIESLREKTQASVRMTILVVERHPLKSEDDKIQEFCMSLPCKVQWGHFLSFEDPVVCQLLDERAIKILDMFGMGANELINSKMLSGRLKVALRKMDRDSAECVNADSAAQWFELNSSQS